MPSIKASLESMGKAPDRYTEESGHRRPDVSVIHCLGAGLVGSYVARKLADRGHDVHVHDFNPHWGIVDYRGITIHHGDALDHCEQMYEFGEFDIVVNMLPGDIGHAAIEILNESPYRIVDLSFSKFTPDRNPDKAIEFGATILWDVGIAPGLSNMLLAEAYRTMGPLLKAEVRVGGNPIVPTGGWNYMAPFSPNDVIAEYTRPARVIRNSEQVILPALSERHIIDVPEKGEMEAFLTDGLRSVLNSIPVVEMSEFTVRWPGHIQRFIDERDAGTLLEEQLVSEWAYNHKTLEFTWMEVRAESHDGTTITWQLQDHGGVDGHSMARCTGLVTLCCIDEWLDNPGMLPPGVHAPEMLSPNVLTRILATMTNERVEVEGPIITNSLG